MSTPTNVLALSKPAQGDTDWAGEINGALNTLDLLAGPSYAYFVNPAWTAAALGNGSATTRRHFDTIQGAISARETEYPLDEQFPTIFVTPGSYPERLTITGSVHLCALGGGAQGAACNRPTLSGDGAANDVLTINPASGKSINVAITGFWFRNRYNTSNGTEIADAMMIDALKPASYGPYQSVLVLTDCMFRGMPEGDHNRWSYGIRVDGWWRVYVRDSQFGYYLGPLSDGLVRYPFYLRGDYTNGGKTLDFFMRNSTTVHTRLAGQTMYTVDGDYGVGGVVDRSAFGETLVNTWHAGTHGTNVVTGFSSDSEAAAYYNMLSRWIAWF